MRRNDNNENYVHRSRSWSRSWSRSRARSRRSRSLSARTNRARSDHGIRPQYVREIMGFFKEAIETFSRVYGTAVHERSEGSNRIQAHRVLETWLDGIEQMQRICGWSDTTYVNKAAPDCTCKSQEDHAAAHAGHECASPLQRTTDRGDVYGAPSPRDDPSNPDHRDSEGSGGFRSSPSDKSSEKQQVLSIGAGPKSNDARFLDVSVNGWPMRAYVDLGSECVTLRRREVELLGLEIEPHSVGDGGDLRGYGGSSVRPHGTCSIRLKVDLVEATVEAYVVPDRVQNVPVIVGQPFTDRANVTLVQRNGNLRVFESSAANLRELDELPPRKSSGLPGQSSTDSVIPPGEAVRSKILSFSGLLNQLQPNVRWSSFLKIRDKETVQPDRTFKYSDLSVRLAAPHQLQPKPNVSELGFGKYFTDHMLKVFYYEALGGWQMPEITPFENLVLHPAAKVLHYAVELFEGMKAYRGIDGKIRVFRPEMNMDRMNASALRSGLPTFNGMELIKCINRLISIDQEWVPHLEASSLYIRPTLIGIDPTLGVATSDSAMLYVILSPVGSYFKHREMDRGISLLADPRYTRAWPGGCGDRKMGSNYAPTIHVQKEATEKGLQQVLWLYGEDHQLTEAGTMNIFLLCINDQGEKELITPPLNGLILPGITRNSILALVKEWNQYKVTERKITMAEVCQLLLENRLLELFGAGTACIVSPISFIEYMGQSLYLPTMDHTEPVHRALLKRLTEIQYGYIDHPWALPIE